MSERYTSARMPAARAVGAPSVMAGTYNGAELASRSSRPGAYDALSLPSLVNGERRPRGAPEPEAPAAVAPTVMMRAPAVQADAPPLPELVQADKVDAAPDYPRDRLGRRKIPRQPGDGVYRPRQGSLPWRVIERLKTAPGKTIVTYREIETELGLPLTHITGTFSRAVSAGALQIVKVNGRSAFALPDHVAAGAPAPAAPAAAVAVDAPPAVDAETDGMDVQQALYELAVRESAAQAWIVFVEILQLRLQILKLSASLPFPALPAPLNAA